jgi:predicted membrane protein
MGTSGGSARIWIGVILIVFGAFFLLENFFHLPFHIPYYLRQWQWILVLIGIVIILTSQNKTGGIVLVGIGLFFLYGFKLLLPLVLVGLGIHFILRRNKPVSNSASNFTSRFGSSSYQEDMIDDVSIFGGGTKVVQSDNFKGGKVTAIFGGSEIIMTDCKLAEGDNFIDIVAIFGGSTLVVPKDWKIVLDLVPVFGGFSDNRRKDPNLIYDSNKTLVIKGFILFGGGELKT